RVSGPKLPVCPVCEKTLHASVGVEIRGNDVKVAEGVTPGKGDISMCSHCGTFLSFTSTDSVVELTEEDILAMSDERRSELARVRLMYRRAKAEKAVRSGG